MSTSTFTKQGVLDEWEYCRSIEKQYGLKDFIIPVKIDNSAFNSRIGLNVRNIISFEEYWGLGLKRLLKKLSSDQVPRTETTALSVVEWYNNVFTNFSGLNEEQDTFFSNWIKIENLPKKINFFKFTNEEQAKAILENNLVYPGFRHGNIIITFQNSLEYFIGSENLEITPSEIFSKDTASASMYYEESEFPTYKDLRRLLVRLLRECFEMHLKSKNLLIYQLASHNQCYFFPINEESKTKGKFFLNGKPKNIGVTGKYYDSFWHFAISFKPILYPELSFSIKSHIIFSEKENKIWTDKKAMHSSRRDKGKTMRNKEWRDQLLAFLSCIKDDEQGIKIPVSEKNTLLIPHTPIMFSSKFSYTEPNDEERLISIDSYLEEEDFYDDVLEGDNV